MYREFAQFEEFGRLPAESTILRFCHRLENHKPAEQTRVTVNELLAERGLLLNACTAVDAILIAVLTSTKNKAHSRDTEMHSNKKGNQWYFGMKVHIGVDAETGLVHVVRGTSGHVSDIAEANTLLQGQERVAFGDADYRGSEKRHDAKVEVFWHVAMRPGKRKALNKENEADALIDKAEKLKAGIRAKVEHPFRVVKRQFGFVKAHYRGLKKNTEQLFMLFALSNLWMVRWQWQKTTKLVVTLSEFQEFWREILFSENQRLATPFRCESYRVSQGAVVGKLSRRMKKIFSKVVA